jgi:malonyl CoA-acyl carrier protein transacylase
LFDEFKDITAAADDILGYSIEDLCHNDPQGRLRDTRYAQPAIFLVNAMLAAKHIAANPGRYRYFAGHSLGEFNALVAAGSIDLYAALGLVQERAILMSQIKNGGMAAVVGLPWRLVDRALRDAGLAQVYIASRNSDQQTTIAGDRAQLAVANRILTSAGAVRVSALNVSGPFHTPMMAPAKRALAEVLRRHTFKAGDATVISSVTGEPFDYTLAGDLLSRQLAEPVEWVRTVRTLRAAGVTRFDEINGRTLTSLVEGIR